MRHDNIPLDLDLVDSDARVSLTVTVELLITLTALLVEYENLLAATVFVDRGLDRTFYIRRTNTYLAVIAGQKNVAELDRVTDI